MKPFVLWLLWIVVINGSILKKEKPVRIAVIGAGIGGSSFVHYFNKLQLDHSVDFHLDIYERNPKKSYGCFWTASVNVS